MTPSGHQPLNLGPRDAQEGLSGSKTGGDIVDNRANEIAAVFEIGNDMDRCVFRSFAMAHPEEAAQMNWPEFVALAKALNPEITEEAIRKILEKNSGKSHER